MEDWVEKAFEGTEEKEKLQKDGDWEDFKKFMHELHKQGVIPKIIE